MESILIVDDEPVEREGIRSNLNWEALGFDSVEIAADGQQALQMIEQAAPSVLLTDICMPFMDGLTLCKKVKKINPAVKIVILTGHDEFPYAQEALRLGAAELILKPVTADELSKILRNVCLLLENERAAKLDLERLRAQMKESLPLLQERFLMRLLYGRVHQADWEGRAVPLGINFRASVWGVLSVQIDHWDQINEARDYEESELLWIAMEELCREHNHDFIDYYQLHDGNNNLMIILGGTNPDFEENLNTYGQFVCQTVSANLGITVTIGVGRPTSELRYLPDSRREALTALSYRMILGGDRVISIADMEPDLKAPFHFKTEYSYGLATAVRTGAVDEVVAAVDTLFQSITEKGVTVAVCRMIVMHAVMEIFEAAYKSDEDYSGNYEMFSALQYFETLAEIQMWLRETGRSLADQVRMRRESEVSVLIENAKGYINENYSNPDLSIKDICNILHISPSYFSYIFKRETGSTFLNFLIEIRMQKAKELLLTTSLKGYQIAERVGYADPNYFSICFRKYFNVSPGQYRDVRGGS